MANDSNKSLYYTNLTEAFHNHGYFRKAVRNRLYQKFASKKDKPKQAKNQPAEEDSSDDDKIYSVKMGNLEFKIYQGDLTAAKVGAIVNGTNTELDLSKGAVAKAIKRKGGKGLEKQLNDNKDTMKKDKIVVTKHASKSDGLTCDFVIHLDMTDINAGMLWTDPSGKLKEKIKQALDKAEELQVTSIAFPALGTSATTKISVSETAKDTFKVVEAFHKTCTHVKEVHVIIYEKDMLEDYVEAVKAIAIANKDKGYIARFLHWSGIKPDPNKASRSRHNRILIGAQAHVIKDNNPVAVRFTIYAKGKRSADEAAKLLEKIIDQEYRERIVKARILSEFTDEQIKEETTKLSEGGKVTVNIDKSKNEIKIRGLMLSHISDAVDAANEIIKSAEQTKQSKQKADLVSDTVQWFYMQEEKGKKELVAYPGDVNLILELAVKEQKKNATFNDKDGNKYVVDLDDYMEYPADDPKDTVQVLRKLKRKTRDEVFDLPLIWSKMDEKENLKLVDLKPSDKEYKDVTAKFLATAGGVNVEFVKVERVQNKTLYQQYAAKKMSMEATNPKGHQNERELWHGFSVDALDSICRYGFNRSYCGKNATALGAGVYFAVNVNYSISDTYSRPDTSGHKRMFLCKVLVGEYCNGNSSLRVPPVKPGAKEGGHILYDTVTNSVQNPIMFVIFHDSQAVPEYLLTFKRK